ncbi:hypothetical protein BC830DRAFT_399067 [Chytriomyces sp. MP71]|nr:hypothetical protein BC830DRAFT_399067 [Chytriomyces sp. MP71]
MARKTERERHFVLQFKGHSVVLPGDAGPVLTGIVKAILHSGANTPRTPKDLTDTMLAHGYAHLGGLTPHATVSSRISTHFKKCNETGMEPLLGRLRPNINRVASASNTRKIKYYVLQLPFEVVEDFTVVLQPHEQAKLPKRDTTPPRPSSALFAANRDSNAGSSSNSNGGPKRKRKVPAAASAEGSKRPSSTHATTSSSASTTSIVVKKTPASAYFDSDSEDPDTDFVAVDTDIELDIDSTRGVHIELQLNHPGTRRSNSFDSRSTQSIWPQGSITGDSHEPDFHVHMDNELSDDGNSDGGSSLETASQSMPPQNPEQTFHFSPVFQSHIFIRPNATTLPPLSTLQNQGSLSQLSPTLFSASPPVDIQNQQHNFPHSARVFIPSPILLPSPRVFGVASPQLSSAHPLSNLRPLDLGPGLYSGHGVQMAPLSSRTLGPLPGSKAPGNSAPVEHPESVSVEDLDEIFMDYDNKRKHFQHQHEHAGPSKRRRSSVSKHVRHQPQHHHKLRTHHESRQPQSNSKFLGLNDVLPPLSMHQLQCERPPSAPQPRRPSISGLIKRPSPLLRPQPHITCELSDVHINVPLSESQTFAASSSKNNTPAAGQIVTVTRFRTGPLISMPLHNILVRSDDEKTMQSPTNRVHQNLTDFIRMGDLMRFYSAPHLFDRTITDMDPSFVALWARFCKYLLQMSLAPRGTAHRPMSPGCEEVDAAAVLVGLASPVLVGLPDSGAVVADGGDSFAVKVEGDVAEGARLFKSPLVIAVVKASAGSSRASTRPIISHECNGIWIPLEVAQYLTEMLDVPSRIKDIFTFQPIPASSAGNLQGVRVRSYSTSSYSSLASSRTKRKNTPDAASETAYLKFDDSDNEEEIDVGKEMLAPPLLSLAASPSSNDLPTAILESTPATNIDPSTLTLIPASNIAEALMWMTTIDGVFVYITWITSASTAASGSDDNQVGTPILRRVDNGLVNASQLLHAGGIHDEQEKSVVLSLERVRKRFRREDSALRGTWIPLARARELARTVSLDARLATFLSDEAGSTYFGVVATGAAGGGPSGVASPMRRKKVAASLVVGPDGVMRVKGVVDTGVPGVVGGGSGSRKRVHRFAVQAAKARASGSSLYSNVNDISSYASVLSLSPQKTIYPPGSLAERDHQRALEALAANSDAFVGAVSGEVSNGPVGTTTQSSSDASQKVTDATTTLSSVKFEPDPESSINPAAVVVDTSTLK